MAKKKNYKRTTIARAKASVLKYRSTKKKAGREAVSGKTGHPKTKSSPPEC
jgi:hypothetical protein